MLPDIMFYVFSAIMLAGALGVVIARNPIFSVLSLVVVFFNAAGLFLLLGAEFLGLLLVLVYVGAIAVMFLFVLMTIDIDFKALSKGFATYLPMGLVVAVFLAVELFMAIKTGLFNIEPTTQTVEKLIDGPQNIIAIGQVLFTDYLAPFQLAGLILLVAMVGAITLTHRRREHVQRQDISKQIFLKPEDAVEIKKVKPGQGLV